MKQNLLKKFRKTQSGQAIVEYIIIVALVAIAAITVISLFSDRIREMFSGATEELGGETETIESSKDSLKDLGND
ncbi:MAG: Flp family type IVb pilin [Lentisphaerae bacterium]|nr:Flp family type IVb pilin [Lentisphaerota bacterium]